MVCFIETENNSSGHMHPRLVLFEFFRDVINRKEFSKKRAVFVSSTA